MNNNGIYGGVDESTWAVVQEDSENLTEVYVCESYFIIYINYLFWFFRIPPNCLSVNIHYENILTLFGRKGYFCTTVEQVSKAIKEAFTVNIYYSQTLDLIINNNNYNNINKI